METRPRCWFSHLQLTGRFCVNSTLSFNAQPGRIWGQAGRESPESSELRNEFTVWNKNYLILISKIKQKSKKKKTNTNHNSFKPFRVPVNFLQIIMKCFVNLKGVPWSGFPLSTMCSFPRRIVFLSCTGLKWAEQMNEKWNLMIWVYVLIPVDAMEMLTQQDREATPPHSPAHTLNASFFFLLRLKIFFWWSSAR